jgi:hypothetical protein
MSSDPNPRAGMAKPGENDNPVTGDEADQPFWDIAAQIREERQQWVIIWLAPQRRFRAYPKFRPPAGMTSASGSTRDELLADIDRIEQAAHRPGGRSDGHPDPAKR